MADEDKDKKSQTTKPDVTKSKDNSGSFVWHAPKPSKPQTSPSQEKEVKPVYKDKTGQFDYSNCKVVTVKKGQHLVDVANENLVALQQVRYFNHINKATMQVKEGQFIVIPHNPINVPTGK